MKELVNQQRERKPQPLSNVDFKPEDAVHLPPDRVCAGCELRARRRKGNTNLRFVRGEGILPPKHICVRLSDKLELGDDAVRIPARENFPGFEQRRGWFFTHATVGEAFSVGHLVSSSKLLPEWCLGDK